MSGFFCGNRKMPQAKEDLKTDYKIHPQKNLPAVFDAGRFFSSV
jgi:hypothetical protein